MKAANDALEQAVILNFLISKQGPPGGHLKFSSKQLEGPLQLHFSNVTSKE